MNERKKKGRSADSGPSVGNYGATKKSLGYRFDKVSCSFKRCKNCIRPYRLNMFVIEEDHRAGLFRL